jgi:hypothetical protein
MRLPHAKLMLKHTPQMKTRRALLIDRPKMATLPSFVVMSLDQFRINCCPHLKANPTSQKRVDQGVQQQVWPEEIIELSCFRV